jgi:microcystin-dependent protein
MATIPAPGRILTGDLPTGQTARFSFRAPSDFWIRAVINGIFNRLVYPDAWTQGGIATEQDTADIFSKIVWTITMSSDIGQVLSFATIALPAYCLPCNGASLLRTDYPELFAAIGVLWGNVDGTHFNVPDFRGRVLVDAGAGSGLTPRAITDSGGAESIALGIPEMPTHAHSGIPTFVTTAAGLEPALASAQTPFSIDTGTNGGGLAHDNMQPFVVVNWGIVYTDEQ